MKKSGNVAGRFHRTNTYASRVANKRYLRSFAPTVAMMKSAEAGSGDHGRCW